jgi:hypothetical protein
MNARSYTSTLPNIFTAWYLVYVQYMSWHGTSLTRAITLLLPLLWCL